MTDRILLKAAISNFLQLIPAPGEPPMLLLFKDLLPSQQEALNFLHIKFVIDVFAVSQTFPTGILWRKRLQLRDETLIASKKRCTVEEFKAVCEDTAELLLGEPKQSNGGSKSPDEPEQVVQTKTTSKSIQSRFTFDIGCVSFDGKDVGLPSSDDTIEVFRKLLNNLGKVTPFRELDEESMKSEASEKLRGQIRHIRSVIKDKEIPCVVTNKKSSGYILSES
jgi:hypothetical protein